MGGSSIKVLKGNIDYHQENLLQDSLCLLAEETMKFNLEKNNNIEVARDVVVVNGLTIYGDYYVKPNTNINLSGIKSDFESRDSLYSLLEYERVILSNLTYDEELTTYAKKNVPFGHSIVISYDLETLRNGVEHTYKLQLTAVFNVKTDIDRQKAYITNINITDVSILEVEE